MPFQVCFVAKNNGGDGHVGLAQIMEGDTVLAEKFVAVDGGPDRPGLGVGGRLGGGARGGLPAGQMPEHWPGP